VNSRNKSKKFMVMNIVELVIGHNRLYVSTKLTSYWTQKKVSYSVQPTMQKMIGEVQKCQKVTKYVYKFGPFV
jgi:hypothetical protein